MYSSEQVSTYGQLCWSNASLLEYLTQRARKVLQADPDANIISISQNDNYNYCQSDEEMKIIKEEVRCLSHRHRVDYAHPCVVAAGNSGRCSFSRH